MKVSLCYFAGGHFVCKLFDIFTLFSVGLVYLMYRAFDHVTIFKPVTSRPANSERSVLTRDAISLQLSFCCGHLCLRDHCCLTKFIVTDNIFSEVNI